MGVNKQIKVLDIQIYSRKGTRGKDVEVYQPTWIQIKEAIRALDQYCHPSVFLRLNYDEPWRGWLAVLGGNGIYSINGTIDGEHHLGYFDRSKGKQAIEVWTSDQGYAPEERRVCYELPLVLKIARYWAEHGGFDPRVKWRE